MSIKHYLTAFAGVAMLAACSDYDPGIAQKGVLDLTAEEEKFITEDYTDGFKIAMGVSNIDSDHSWGFPTESASAAKTRSANQANNNQWIHLNKDNQDNRNLTSITYIDDAPVPGFPSATDGLYHIYQNGNPVAKTYDEIVTMVKNGTDEVNPVGDVTDEEILYVSAWFRNHKNPTPDPLNVDHFYTQCISKDYDRTAYAHTDTLPRGDGWWESDNGVGAWNKNVELKWYKDGVLSSVDNNNQPVSVSYRTEEFSLDQLGVKAAGIDNDYVHIYNDNAGNTSRISEANPTSINYTDWSALTGADANHLNLGIVSDKSYRSIMYMNNSATTDFRAWNSGNSHWETRWVLKHLTFTGRDGKPYDGWYLAFDVQYMEVLTEQDFWDSKEEQYHHWVQKEERPYDGYYSNYIVKITPGNGSVTPPPPATLPSYRVMCEDLGNSYDFDFNDIVFDVDYEYTETEGTYKATVTLQAAGGTLPIYIYQYNAAHEAHNMLNGGLKQQGKETYRPINVREDDGKDFSVAPAQTFSFTTTSLNPDDIDIYVSNVGNIGTRVIKLPKAGEVTAAPMKFAVKDKTVKWMRESQLINLTYTHFPDWVTSDNSIYNPNTGSKPWTKTDLQNLGLLW